MPEMVASVVKMMEKWEEESKGKDQFELEMQNEFHDLIAEILSKTAFSSSFEEGKHIFQLQEQQVGLALLALRSVYFPGFR